MYRRKRDVMKGIYFEMWTKHIIKYVPLISEIFLIVELDELDV